MTTDVKVPASGESIASANVARWHRKNGDNVVKGEVLVTLETDKISNELEAPVDGVMEILVPEGEEVPIGETIARIRSSAAKTQSAPETAPTPLPKPVPAPAATPAPAAAPAPLPVPPAAP